MTVQVGNPGLPWAPGEPAVDGQARRKGDGASQGGEQGRKRKTGERGVRKGDGEATGRRPASESEPAGKQLSQLPDGETEGREWLRAAQLLSTAP